MKRILFIILIVISSFAIFSSALAALTCTVANSCSSPDTTIFRISGSSNAQAELPSQSNYPKYVCCSGVSGIGNNCAAGTAVTALRLSSSTNAHVEENTQGNYSNNACLSISSGTVSVGYQSGSCSGYDTTLVSISGVTNAHVGGASDYALKVCASAAATTPPSPTPPPPSGGGGGGGGVTQTGITFSGYAYPLSRVTVLKDGQVAITTIAGPDARFSTTLGGLSTGNYNFSVYAEDSNGNRSTLFTFPIYFTSGTTTAVGGIYIAPTIDTDKSQVKKGDTITILGQTIPESTVTISVHSGEEFFRTALADDNGAYFYQFDSSPLEMGQHSTKSKTASGNQVTPYGTVVAFAVGTENVLRDGSGVTCPSRGDLNTDCRVNLIDFSIMAFWYKKLGPPVTVDLNGDRTVNLVDFSILAYNWTG